MPAGRVFPSDQIPPWPSGVISYAIAQLLLEFPHTDAHALIVSVNSAAAKTEPIEGSVLLMRRAREILRQTEEERLRVRTG